MPGRTMPRRNAAMQCVRASIGFSLSCFEIDKGKLSDVHRNGAGHYRPPAAYRDRPEARLLLAIGRWTAEELAFPGPIARRHVLEDNVDILRVRPGIPYDAV